VIVRGVDRTQIVRDDRDRAAFVARLGDVATRTETIIYAWALLPNHAHLLLRSAPTGLPRFMRRVLTGYAVTFNRRHSRTGHLFQNRYGSIVCEEDGYFRELVRYIHLNPLRAGLVRDIAALDRYPWSGHAALLGRLPCAWQDRRGVLAWFGDSDRKAVRAYRAYLEEGIPLGRRPELVGGGLVRSAGGWAEVRAMRRRNLPAAADARVLGSGSFVEALWREADTRVARVGRRTLPPPDVAAAVQAVCGREGVSARELEAGSRRGRVSAVRAGLARHLVGELGLPLAEAARHLGVSTSAISKALSREERKQVK
jgi:REP element-mobilizing transposase RayT